VGSLGAVLLGLINVGITVAILILIGLAAVWLLKWIANIEIPQQIQKVYLVIVALIALYMLVALLLGLPTWGPVVSGSPFRHY
jgi:hypothetical protein